MAVVFQHETTVSIQACQDGGADPLEVNVRLNLRGSQGRRGRFYGEPGDCYPSEDAEIDLLSVDIESNQVCPRCEGAGQVFCDSAPSDTTTIICSMCRGKGRYTSYRPSTPEDYAIVSAALTFTQDKGNWAAIGESLDEQIVGDREYFAELRRDA